MRRLVTAYGKSRTTVLVLGIPVVRDFTESVTAVLGWLNN